MPIQEYTEIITQSMMLSNLHGRVDMNAQIGEARSKSVERGAMSEYVGEVFAVVPDAYNEALKMFIAKNIINKKEFEKLDKKIRKYAFTVANTDSEWLISKMKDSIQTALAEGIPTAEWLGNIDAIFQNAGMTKLNDYHLKTVFRTNMQTALNQGKMAIIQQADIEEFPLIELVTIDDGPPRARHALNPRLKDFRAPKDDPIWGSLTPPLDYNCRCTLRPVHVSEGLKATKKPDLKDDNLGFIN